MKLSVAMATYNGSAYIEEQLESIREQKRQFDEVIIVDDSSKDNTYTKILQFIRRYHLTEWKAYQNEHNLGYIQNFRKVISMCTGDIIFTCDQDDIWHQNKAQEFEYLFTQKKEAKVIASSLRLIDNRGEGINKAFIPYGLVRVGGGELTQIGFMSIMEKNFFPGCVMAFRKQIAREYLQQTSCGEQNRTTVQHDWMILILGSVQEGLYWYNVPLTNYRIHEKNTAGLYAADYSGIRYALKTLETWPEYLEMQYQRVYAIRNYIFSAKEKIKDDYRKLKVFVDLRYKVYKTHKMHTYLREVRWYVKYMRNDIDYRGIILDLLLSLRNII